METLDLVIEKLSLEYRSKRKECEDIKKGIRGMEFELESDEISHARYLELQCLIKTQNEKYKIEMSFADGISKSREIVFELLKYDKSK